MRRLNLTFFMELGEAIAPLADLPPRVPNDDDNLVEASPRFRIDILQARRALKTLLDSNAIPLAIPASRPAAEALMQALFGLRDKPHAVRQDMWEIYWKAKRLQTLLHGELAIQTVYHIWPKRAFDINLLIDKASCLFSPSVQQWLTDDERCNIEQAGKCIAFETPTASGFHLIRATESVIRRYYAVVVGTEPAMKMRNWGAYIKSLKKCNGDARVIHALEQIKDLHRNPVIHPEVSLTLEEAISLIGICESVVSSIHADMLTREEKTGGQNALALAILRSKAEAAIQ